MFIHRDLTGSHWLAASESVSSPSPLASVEMADLRPWKLPCVGVPNIRNMSLYICACLHAVCPALAPLERGKSSRTKGKHESSSPAYDLSACLGLAWEVVPGPFSEAMSGIIPPPKFLGVD